MNISVLQTYIGTVLETNFKVKHSNKSYIINYVMKTQIYTKKMMTFLIKRESHRYTRLISALLTMLNIIYKNNFSLFCFDTK